MEWLCRAFLRAATCRTGATGRRLPRLVRAAWQRWRRRSFWKRRGIEPLRRGRRSPGFFHTMTMLAENLERLEASIAEACRRAGRPRAEVELMAVAKTYPAATIAEAAGLGLTLFGENRVQEFAGKAVELEPLHGAAAGASPIRVHLIGHLQSNKAQRAVELFDGIDSVDSLRLAERLNEAAGKCARRLPVLLEVKLSPEETKAGLDPHSTEAGELLERFAELENLQMRGLMT